MACRSFCLAGGEIKNEAQGHARSCHWSSRISQNISCTLNLEIIKMVAVNNNSVQQRRKSFLLKSHLFFASFAKKSRLNRWFFKWFSYYFNNNGVSPAHFKVTAQSSDQTRQSDYPNLTRVSDPTDCNLGNSDVLDLASCAVSSWAVANTTDEDEQRKPVSAVDNGRISYLRRLFS